MGVAASRRPGFTLLELLVVIAVLAMLAAILLPVFAHARRRAWQTSCLAHVGQIAQAHLLYVQDYDDRFPDWCFPNLRTLRSHERIVYWTTFLRPYMGGDELLLDPAVRGRPRSPTDLADYTLLTLGAGGLGTWESPYWHFPGSKLTMAQVVRSAETISVMDGLTNVGMNGASRTRHQGGASVGFLDGHARWMRFENRAPRLDDGHGFYWMRYYTADR